MRRATFDALAEKHPALLRGLARVVVELLRKRTATTRTQHAVGTITVLPIVECPETNAFAAKLAGALSVFGPTLHVDVGTTGKATRIDDVRAVRPGSDEDTQIGSWLAGEEERRAFLVFEADASLTPWTDRCLRQADLVVAVGRSDDDPVPSEAEQALAERADAPSRARQVLVLLHAGDAPRPGTRAWLAPRSVDQHHHVRTGHPGDLERLARILSGNAVGLVLGGGGARGFAHVGVHRALVEHGIPIDWVGGTSIGAVFSAAIALGWDPDRVEAQGRNAFVDERPFNDLTVPIVSLLSGRRIDRLTRRLFETQIEDMLLPYFCVSSDLTSSSLRVHEDGDLWRAIRSSVSLPGVLPPTVLSRHLAIDGAMLNNLPVDVMRDRAVSNVIAVDLSAGEEAEELDVLEIPSPLQILLSRLPFSRRARVPGIVTVLVKATLMASAVHSRAMRGDADLLLSPPVGRFGLLESNAFDAIVEVGYDHAREALKAWPPRPAPHQGGAARTSEEEHA